MKKLLAITALTLALVGCDKSQPQAVYVQPQQPVYVQQSNGAADVVTGMAVGAMLGHALSSSGPTYQPSYNRSTTIVNHTTIVQASPRPNVPVAVPVTPRQSQTTSAISRSSSFSRPSFSRSSSSSFGSFSRRR